MQEPRSRTESRHPSRAAFLLPAASALMLAAAFGGAASVSTPAASASVSPVAVCAYVSTPAVSSGGVFSDARDTALASCVPAAAAVSSGGVFSDARDAAASGLALLLHR